MSKVNSKILCYPHRFIYFKDITCEYVYEWSIGSGTENQNAAAERLLTWMLGNRYQNYLMISQNESDYIPLCDITFNEYVGNNTRDYEALLPIVSEIQVKER